MKMTRMMAVAAVAGAIAWASIGIGAQDNTMREARDRDEIEALMWKYTRALDTADANTYASTYTENGQFSAGGATATKGRAALTKTWFDLGGSGESGVCWDLKLGDRSVPRHRVRTTGR